MLLSLQLVKGARTRSGILENVQGLKVKDPDHDHTALDVLVTSLARADFETEALEVDMASFHQFTRKRPMQRSQLPAVAGARVQFQHC